MSIHEHNRPRPLIYIAGGLTRADDSKLVVYKDIQAGCFAAGFDAYLPHEDTGSRKDNLDPQRVMEANFAAINRSSAIIAEVGLASHGVGMEIEYAARRGKPVLAIAPAQAEVSRMVLGHPGVRGGVRRYARTQEVRDLVVKLLGTELLGHESSRSRLIAIEGPDFVGKGSVCRYLASKSKDLFQMDALLVTDPPWQLPPWDTLSNVFRYDNRLSGPAEALLFGAARVDNYYRCIKPALAEGKLVLCDRYVDSWFAYQSIRLKWWGENRALDFLLAQQTMLEAAQHIEPPGLTILLMADVEELRRRHAAQPRLNKYEAWNFLTEVVAAYEELHSRFPYRIVRCETTGREESFILDFVAEIVADYLKASA
jgi:dTMP kinase